MTTPPVLDLRPEALDRPSKSDLALVEAMMLWPDNEAARGKWMVAAMIEWGWANIEDLPEAALRRWALEARAARDSPSLAELQPEANKRFPYGFIIGRIVLEATMLVDLAPDHAALGKVQASVADRLKGLYQIQPRTMNNKEGPIYPLRPVAHLWAANAMLKGGEINFPCKASQLGVFLATAEAIRELAEQARVKQSPSTAMRAGEAVRLPVTVAAALPNIRLAEYALQSFPE